MKEELESQDTELLALIESKPYKAYALDDLIPKTDNLVYGFVSALMLQSQLDKLVKKGLIKSKNVRGKVHYISPKAL